MMTIELYAHKNVKGIYSGQYTAIVFVKGIRVARIDAGLNFLKVDFQSTLLSRSSGVDNFLNGDLSVHALLKNHLTSILICQ